MKLDEHWLHRLGFQFRDWLIGSDGMFKYEKHYFKNKFFLMEQADGYYSGDKKIQSVAELKRLFFKRTRMRLKQVITVNGI